MPKYELKVIQQELEQGKFWPVYWLYGAESWKVREVLNWIREAVCKAVCKAFCETFVETLDGSEISVEQIKESAMSLSFSFGSPSGGSNGGVSSPLRFLVIREAHALKDLEEIAVFLGPQFQAQSSEPPSLCVFIAKDLDGRKKISKSIVEKAAVVSCEEVPESKREMWIQFLAKRKKMKVEVGVVGALMTLDPWSLDRVEQELEKWQLGGGDVLCSDGEGPDRRGAEEGVAGDQSFVEYFFSKDFHKCLAQVGQFASQQEVSLPLLGLLSWHLKQLIFYQTGALKPKPYLADRLRIWSEKWTLPELITTQREMAYLDLCMKQTRHEPLGLWTGFIISVKS